MIADEVRIATGDVLSTRTDWAALPPKVNPVKGIQWYTRIDNPPAYDAERQTLAQTGATLDENARTRTVNYSVTAKTENQIFAELAPQIEAAERLRKIRAMLDDSDVLGVLELKFKEGSL